MSRARLSSTPKKVRAPMRRYELNQFKHLSDEELAHLKRNTKTSSLRDRTLIHILIHTGARATEVLNITPQDLNHKDKTVFIRGLKNSADRELPLPPRLFEALAALALLNCDTGLVFPIKYQRLKQIWDWHCPVRGKGPHAARHTVGINLYKKTNNLNLVKLVLGHRSIANTMIYSEYVFSKRELKKLIL